MKLSVIIPAYNESTVIVQTARLVVDFLNDNFPRDYELIIVDDGSSDGTGSLVQNQLGTQARLITHTINQGKGAAVRTGMMAAQGDFALFMDADNSTDIQHVVDFLVAMEKVDIVIGSRAVAGSEIAVAQKKWKRTLGRLGNWLIRSMLDLDVSDTQCGFKLFRTATTRHIFVKQRRTDWAFDFELLYVAHKAGLKIKELPVRWVNNFESKVTVWGYVTTLVAVFSVKYHYWKGDYSL
jgi:glycosyltransferase involved in cell wall biosynthesis